MQSQEAWQIILDSLSKGKLDIPTTPTNGRNPLWFSAEVIGEGIRIDCATNKTDSCDLKRPRKLVFRKFDEIYPYYFEREKGKHVSKIVTGITRHQVYYYGLIRKALTGFEA